MLKEIFRRGEDVHTATACRVFGVTPDQIDPGMRSKAKMINYGIVYGLSAYGMADRLDIPQAEADEFIQRYLAGFPAVERFIEETIEQGTEHGYVSTLFGRRRQVPELRARRWELRKQGERFAVNMVIQGTAADIMKVAMVRCDQRARRGRPPVASWFSRSTTSCCSRARPRRPSASGDRGARRWRAPTSSTRRWPSTPASAPTGCRRSSVARPVARRPSPVDARHGPRSKAEPWRLRSKGWTQNAKVRQAAASLARAVAPASEPPAPANSGWAMFR